MLEDNSTKAKKDISVIMSTARIWALMSIVCAHISFNNFFDIAFSRFGNIGVIVFFIIAGYYFDTSKFKSFGHMLKKKSGTIIIPWLSVGTIVYLFGWINAFIETGKTFSVGEYIAFIIDNGSYLYYLTVLVLLFVVFYCMRSKTALYMAMALTVISQLLTAFGLLDGITKALLITHYLNIFNWCGFFAIGKLLQRLRADNLLAIINKIKYISIIAYAAFFSIACVFRQIRVGYFGMLGIPYELLGAAAVASISCIFPLTKKNVFFTLSNDSFTIYLIHYMVYSLMDSVLVKNQILICLTPCIVIAVCFLLLEFASLVSKKLKIEKAYKMITGTRSIGK